MKKATILGGEPEEQVKKRLPEIVDIRHFLFEAPLYAKYSLGHGNFMAKMLLHDDCKIDGHCLQCGKSTTFFSQGGYVSLGGLQNLGLVPTTEVILLECARSPAHKIRYWLYIYNGIIKKAGQLPSMADIANDEARKYRKFMSKGDANEFSKAIGLAAHGVGVGSFVYLRRIFENLINRRFVEKSAENDWDENNFRTSRLEDKINLLQNDLPEFLVKNKKIYSILSLGIHELNEEQCLSYFDVMHRSIVTILKEDKRNRESLEDQQALEKSINSIGQKNSRDK